MELFSFLETPKIRNLQPCANKRTYLTKTLEYGDDKKHFRFPRALRSKTISRVLRLASVLNEYGHWKT